MLSRLFIFSSLLAALCSCDTNSDEPTEGMDVVQFYVQAMINGDSVMIQAGEQGFFMHTNSEYSSLFAVHSFEGELSEYGCLQPCLNSVRFTIFDAQQSTSDVSFAADLLQPGTIPFGLGSLSMPANYRLTLQGMATGQHTSQYWFIDDSLAGTADSLVVDFRPNEGGFRTFCYVVEQGGLADTICYDIDPVSACDARISSTLNGDTGTFTAIGEQAVLPITTSWTLPNGLTALSPQIQFIDTTNGAVKACLRIEDANGCVAFDCKQIIYNSSTAALISNFTHTKSRVPYSEFNDFGSLAFTYVDQNGKQYSSDRFPQPSSSYFNVLEAQDYTQNNNGLPTSQLSIEFDCMVYGDDESEVIHFENGKGVIAIAHP